MMNKEIIELAKLMGDYEIQKKEAEFRHNLYLSAKKTFDKELEKYINGYLEPLNKAEELEERINIMLHEMIIELNKPLLGE